jgi:penicillin-binding protein 1C
MLAAVKRTAEDGPARPQPDETLAERQICALSGELANLWCPVRRREWVPREAEPVPCSWHHLSERGVEVYWPPAFREWARTGAGNPAVPEAPSRIVPAANRPAPGGRAPTPVLEIASPPAGATYLIDPTLRREFQTLPLRVVAPAPVPVSWTVDGVHFGRASSEAALDWPLRAGTHRISVRDDAGRTASSTITVR